MAAIDGPNSPYVHACGEKRVLVASSGGQIARAGAGAGAVAAGDGHRGRGTREKELVARQAVDEHLSCCRIAGAPGPPTQAHCARHKRKDRSAGGPGSSGGGGGPGCTPHHGAVGAGPGTECQTRAQGGPDGAAGAPATASPSQTGGWQ